MKDPGLVGVLAHASWKEEPERATGLSIHPNPIWNQELGPPYGGPQRR